MDNQVNALPNPSDVNVLINENIPRGCAELKHSFESLANVAAYCEDSYLKSPNKRAALEETKTYTTQSLASVAYQVNVLATDFLKLLEEQTTELQRLESGISTLAESISIHKEKVSRREIGVLASNKPITPAFKSGIIPPARPEQSIKYTRRRIDYSLLDNIGHGVTEQNNRTLQLDRAMANNHLPPANQAPPQTKPPTPPGTIGRASGMGMGTIGRKGSSQYRPGIAVATPNVPSDYQTRAYAMGQQQYMDTTLQDPVRRLTAQYPQGGVPQGIAVPPQQIGQQQSLRYSTNVSSPPPPPPDVQPNQYLYDMQRQSQQVQDFPPAPQEPTTPLPPPPPPDDFYNNVPQGIAPADNNMSPPLPSPPPSAYPAPPQNMAALHQSMEPGLPPPEALPVDENLPDWAPRDFIEKVIAIYDYTAEKEDELTIMEDMVIYVVRKNDDGWFEGVTHPGLRGLFPGNYVEAIL